MRAIIDTDYCDLRVRFIEAKIEPLCGWLWFEQIMQSKYPEQKMTIFYGDEPIVTWTTSDKPTKKTVKATMVNCSKRNS